MKEKNGGPAWGLAHRRDRGLPERWPKDAQGEPEEPVFLCKCSNLDMSDKLLINMLEAYGVPCLCIDAGDGGFGRVVMGMSGQGTEIYVPKSLYNDATELCKEENNEEL